MKHDKNNEKIFDKMKIIKEYGKGGYGQTYIVTIGNKKKEYILKKQKILQDVYDNHNDLSLSLNREIYFLNWIEKLKPSNRKFFMRLISYRRYECDFKFVGIHGTIGIENDSKYCQDMILTKKEGTIDKIIGTLNKQEIISIFCQILYVLYLIHKNDFYHCDTKTDNVCYVNTNNKYVKIGKFGKIYSYGKIVSLIDYGSVISNKFDLKDDYDRYEKSKTYNVDLWLVVEFLLLKNGKLFGQNKNTNRIEPEEILHIIRLVDDKINDTIVEFMNEMNIENSEEVINNIRIDLCDFKKIKKTKNGKIVMYEYIQLFEIMYRSSFIDLLKKVWNMSDIVDVNIDFSTKELLYVKKNYKNIKKILKKYIKK